MFILTCRKCNYETAAPITTIYTPVNVSVKLSLCLTKHHAMEVYWGVEV